MSRLRLLVLGSAAGGGVPQWNCRCRVCSLAWQDDVRVKHRTQSSIAICASGEEWAVVNCAPEILSQIKAFGELAPAGESSLLRSSPIRSVLVTNGDIDHIAGLLSLREGQPFALHATAEIQSVLRQNRIFDVLKDGVVKRMNAELDVPFELVEGVAARIFPVPGKAALYLEGDEVEVGAEGEATVGVEFKSGDNSIFYVPGCARMSDSLARRLEGARAVLFDGTVWRDEEMIEAGVGTKTGRRMGHMPISGPDGSLSVFAGLSVERKIFVHINNTNPILIEDSPERRQVEAAGWEVAHDGMEVTP